MKDAQKDHSLAAMQQLAALLLGKVDPALIGDSAGRIGEFLHRVGSSRPRHEGDGRRRWQDNVIESEIPAGSSVLDLGCGDGELLSRLAEMKRVRGQGIEIAPEHVLACVERGVAVFQTDIESGLRGFPDHCFDYVVLEETLQTLARPGVVLQEMLRVGRRGIVSFPNFGFWRVRLDLGIRGRMPRTEWLPFRWFDTPNIHLLTLQDFLDWCTEGGVRVVESHVLCGDEVRSLLPEDNLYAEEVLLVVEKQV